MPVLVDQGGWPIAALMAPRLLEKVVAAGRLADFADGALIHSRGEASVGLSIVIEGAVRFGLLSEGGDYVELSTLRAGHCFGEATVFADLPRIYSAWAVGETSIRTLSPPVVDRFIASEPEFVMALLKATTRRLYTALEFSHDLRRLPTYVHAAKLINAMRRRVGDVVDCRQSDLADTLGVSRVAIGASLKRLQDEGVIRLGYGKIHIDDGKKLDAWLAAKDRDVIA